MRVQQGIDNRTRLARRYSWIGAALGLGAPVGFGLLRRLLSRTRQPARLGPADQSLPYAYMTATTPAAFWLFGRAIERHEDRLRTSHAQIEQLREEFAAVVAHDLRNPIQAMLFQFDVLLRESREGEVRVPVSTLERLKRGGEHLAQMVNDLLDASRVEVSRLALAPQAVALPEAVTALIERIRPTLGAHPIETEIERDPLPVKADPGRLDQILTNLIENAAKYSEERAPISVHVRQSAGGAEVSVRDRGHGIAPEELRRLFDRFYQSKRAREKKTGLGLGLYITKGLVEAHHGRIEVQSEVGRGSTFTVWLPGVEPS